MTKTVWITSNHRSEPVYHSDPDCPILKQAARRRERRLDRLVEERRECGHCSGYDRSEGSGRKPLRDVLLALDPEDVSADDVEDVRAAQADD